MAKFKTTNKELKANYGKVVKLSYCAIQFLTWDISPVAYGCGVYGWNYDVFDVGGVALCTGYRPVGNVTPNYDVVDAFEERARKIVETYPYSGKRDALQALRAEFIKSI